MTRVDWLGRVLLGAWFAGAGMIAPAHGELVLSNLIVELQAGRNSRSDIEIWNNSDERSYVTIAPAEIVDPGRPTEFRREEADPERLGLLVSPSRMILEPGQHKVIRIATISPLAERERVYRVTVKPVIGEISSDQSGLKVLVGYDVLTIVRPGEPLQKVVGRRENGSLIVRNEGNISVELQEGRQCDAQRECTNLPGKRLYAGAEWRQQLPGSGPVEYSIKYGRQIVPTRF